MTNEGVEIKQHVSFGAIIATFGSILIALGFAWLIALNWSGIPPALKIMILVFATAGAYGSGVALRIHDYKKIGGSLLMLGALLYTLSIFLIAQIFSTDASAQGVALLLLLAWVGILFVSYIFDSSPSLIIALVEFLIWTFVQYIAFAERDNFSIGILTIIYLIIGVGIYGLTQIHKSKNHKFAEIYRFWTALYVLVLTYILSFQTIIPLLWMDGFSISIGQLIFLIIISALAIMTAAIGISMSVQTGKLSEKEVFGFIGLVMLYILLISLAGAFAGESVWRGELSVGLWLMWLFDNVLFILVILSVVGYGTKYKSPTMINLALAFFALDIATRYIGFIADFGGQIGFALLSIIGGIILIFGGLGIEKWRRMLVEKTEKKADQGYAIY